MEGGTIDQVAEVTETVTRNLTGTQVLSEFVFLSSVSCISLFISHHMDIYVHFIYLYWHMDI